MYLQYTTALISGYIIYLSCIEKIGYIYSVPVTVVLRTLDAIAQTVALVVLAALPLRSQSFPIENYAFHDPKHD